MFIRGRHLRNAKNEQHVLCLGNCWETLEDVTPQTRPQSLSGSQLFRIKVEDYRKVFYLPYMVRIVSHYLIMVAEYFVLVACWFVWPTVENQRTANPTNWKEACHENSVIDSSYISFPIINIDSHRLIDVCTWLRSFLTTSILPVVFKCLFLSYLYFMLFRIIFVSQSSYTVWKLI